MRVALDATYSLSTELSGVGVYSQQILFGLARSRRDQPFDFCYRSNRFLRSWLQPIPSNARRRFLGERCPRGISIFHGLNQRLPLRTEAPMVCTFHDLFVMTGEYSSSDFRKRFAAQARMAAERADRIITVSAFTATQVHQLLGVEHSRIRVIPHGVLPPNAPTVTSRENMVLHVGAIQVRKNITRLVEAFELLPPDWRLVLAGGQGYGSGEILERIERSTARERIHLTGYVSNVDLENLYAQASIFAFPSLDEGFGMPVLDAMARGVPVITSNRSALPEVAGDAAILINPYDLADLASALHRLAFDVELRRRLAADGLVRARAFSWAESVEQTWGVYEDLLR